MSSFEKKWGEVCKVCKKRKGTLMTTGKAEGGKSSTCKCEEKRKAIEN